MKVMVVMSKMPKNQPSPGLAIMPWTVRVVASITLARQIAMPVLATKM